MGVFLFIFYSFLHVTNDEGNLVNDLKSISDFAYIDIIVKKWRNEYIDKDHIKYPLRYASWHSQLRAT